MSDLPTGIIIIIFYSPSDLIRDESKSSQGSRTLHSIQADLNSAVVKIDLNLSRISNSSNHFAKPFRTVQEVPNTLLSTPAQCSTALRPDLDISL